VYRVDNYKQYKKKEKNDICFSESENIFRQSFAPNCWLFRNYFFKSTWETAKHTVLLNLIAPLFYYLPVSDFLALLRPFGLVHQGRQIVPEIELIRY